MPKSRRIAEKSAALQTIRELHRRGELDEHLKPVTRDPDSDGEDEEEEGEKDKHAGTERRVKYYRDEVCTTCTSILGSHVCKQQKLASSDLFQISS